MRTGSPVLPATSPSASNSASPSSGSSLGPSSAWAFSATRWFASTTSMSISPKMDMTSSSCSGETTSGDSMSLT